ncbi:hypothetical protein B0J13DRAFT_651585 [Dactylonectria estremocensis]|uniref:Uncharacterized protein n=1 Tax=Dactylonectria estremocensis TaxID=1079267 RepID=A0A9P9IGT2_9HYPO|nr:hypothetical protein B0J13DRAFT_651585 [Dactylonectria estremocensis]
MHGYSCPVSDSPTGGNVALDPTGPPSPGDTAIEAEPCFFRSPVGPKRVLCLDQGWAVAVAKELPEAEVITTDDTIPPLRPLPTNLRVDRCDENTTPSFNLASCKGLLGKVENYERIIENLFLHLVPGGWLELFEISFRPRDENTAWCDILAINQELEDISGFPYTIERQRWVPLMERLGFENVDLKESFQPENQLFHLVQDRVSPLLRLHGELRNVSDQEMSGHISRLMNRLITEHDRVDIQCVRVWAQKAFFPKVSALDGEGGSETWKNAKVRFCQEVAKHIQWEPSALLKYRKESEGYGHLRACIERAVFLNKLRGSQFAVRATLKMNLPSGMDWVLNDDEVPPITHSDPLGDIRTASCILQMLMLLCRESISAGYLSIISSLTPRSSSSTLSSPMRNMYFVSGECLQRGLSPPVYELVAGEPGPH